ncbi:hypothetical protein DFP72DRAFT_800152 [Ephemerocybe angulata]|uniref:TauD/TfdA-like domain-containing protein n=1 Tax=Ephemerocybe angulata TaxID=980116 RepID=A0A8H6MD63_9AGAR|nr:hypothetical protein DFP72DRAFT_800152 [Tulosesus angulatus]
MATILSSAASLSQSQQPDIDYHPDEAKWRARTARRLADNLSLLDTPLPAGFPDTLTGPLVWEGKDWKDESEWVYTLCSEELMEIDKAVQYFEDLNLQMYQISPSTFPLPTLGPVLQKLSSSHLHDPSTARGFVVIRSIPVATYTRFQNLAIYAGISVYIAPTRALQDPGTGGVVGHITDLRETFESSLLGAASYTNESQPFHSDPGDVVALFCLEVAGGGGGGSKLASSWRVYNELAKTRPDLLGVLAGEFPLEMFNRTPPYRMRSMLFHHDGKIIIQNARRLCTGYMGLPRSKDIPPITEAQAEALDALHFLAEKYHLKLNFQKGDIQYVNNLCMFHARDEFLDTSEKRRHLVRIWLRNDELGWKVPPPLVKRWEALYDAIPLEKQKFPLEPELRSASRGHTSK